MINNKNINNYFFVFIFAHLLIWTLVPSLTNINLPLDTIEALAWGSNLDWGFNKHPPFSAFAVEFIFLIFGNEDWAYYFLSQIFGVISFAVIFKLSKEIFNDSTKAFVSVILLEGILFYNFTTPEFNVNVSQMPFWALSAYLTWRCVKYDKTIDFLFLGIVIGCGILSKYLFLYLALCIKFYFIYLIFFKKRKIKFKNLFVTGPVALFVITPHLIWLIENEFVTIFYGLERTGGNGDITDHIFLPILFLLKQISILIPFLIMVFFLLKKYKLKIQKNEKTVYLFFICILPVILIFLTSAFMGAKIRTMWMTPFYLLIGILIIENFKEQINFKKINKFYYSFIFFFILSPLIYASVSIINEFKRTDYPGKEIARLVQNKWDNNFINDIKIVVGDEWFAGNLSYHLDSRPKWTIELKKDEINFNESNGVIYTGNPKILKQICPGVFGTIKPVGYCMIGQK